MTAYKYRPGAWFFENLPKISIGTALAYMIAYYVNWITGGALAGAMDGAKMIMLVGAMLVIPSIVLDIAFTRTFELAEAVWTGFVNFFALMLAYFSEHTDLFMTVLRYMLYIYAGLFLISLIMYTAVYIRERSKAPARR